MEKKEFYTASEKYLIEAMKRHEELEAAAEIRQKTTELLELDEMLLQMEAKADMMDGMKLEEWLL